MRISKMWPLFNLQIPPIPIYKEQAYRYIGISTSCPTYASFWPILALKMSSDCALALGQAGEGRTPNEVPGTPLVRHELPRPRQSARALSWASILIVAALQDTDTQKAWQAAQKGRKHIWQLNGFEKKTWQCLYLQKQGSRSLNDIMDFIC